MTSELTARDEADVATSCLFGEQSHPDKVLNAASSPADQNLKLQHRALIDAGCDCIIDDTMTGTAKHRPGLDAATDLGVSVPTLYRWIPAASLP